MKPTALLLLCFVFTANFCKGQNLVPNGDFEQYDTCQTGINQLYRALHWSDPIQPNTPPYTTPDYFHSCNPNPLCSMPVNSWGYEYAHSGVAYAAIITAHDSTDSPLLTKNYREYLQTELVDTLKFNVSYCISLYVSAGDSFNFVSNNLGVYFSPTEVKDTCHRCCLSAYTPQFENYADLSSRTGWTRIAGTYIAGGGERYIVIGNFRDSAITTATYTNWVTYSPSRNSAMYYIDDVSVVRCDTATGTSNTSSKNMFTVYPNPTSGLLYLKPEEIGNMNFEVFDFVGTRLNLNYKKDDLLIDLSNHPDGIYWIKISNEYFENSAIKILKISTKN